mmetsp:Transcript_7640/g.22566  ORF Transcript_7640/g.22566 Transcript_7640/m.22566 type:complete len:245 (+) Transcript_7640:1645-2379(+)
MEIAPSDGLLEGAPETRPGLLALGAVQRHPAPEKRLLWQGHCLLDEQRPLRLLPLPPRPPFRRCARRRCGVVHILLLLHGHDLVPCGRAAAPGASGVRGVHVERHARAVHGVSLARALAALPARTSEDVVLVRVAVFKHVWTLLRVRLRPILLPDLARRLSVRGGEAEADLLVRLQFVDHENLAAAGQARGLGVFRQHLELERAGIADHRRGAMDLQCLAEHPPHRRRLDVRAQDLAEPGDAEA